MLKAKLLFRSLPALAAKATTAAYSALFPSGSAASIVDSTDVTITPRKHWNSQWLWWCVKHTDLSGKQPSFLIPKASRQYGPVANERLAVWSTAADSDTWTDFTTLTIGATNIEFQHGSAFTAKKIHISNLPMYPFARTQRLIGVWGADSRVSDTPSSANYILGYSTARSADDGSGRTAPALPFYALKITNPSGYTKNKAILTSGNHPDETTGRFALEGAITWLLGGSALAEFLLDWFEIYVYPCVNPQGVWAGYFRSCPQNKTLDHNRQWATTGTLECIDAFKAAMAADTGGVIEVGLDFHTSTGAGSQYGATYDNTEALHVIFTARMNALAGFNMNNLTEAGMLMKLWMDDYAAKLYIIIEQGSVNTRTIAQYKASGQHSLQAIGQMLSEGRFTNGPGVGSREFNGATDRIDWANVANPKASPITISAWINIDDFTPTNQYVVNLQTAANVFGILINVLAAGNLNLVRDYGITDLTAASVDGSITAGAWTHILIMHDGSTQYTTVAFYVNGVSKAHHASTHTNGTGTEAEITGAWCIGGRTVDDTRNFDGKIAQVGIWNRVLTAGEIADLAAGQAPDLAAASGLQFYFKGNTASLEASPGGTGTLDGTTQLTGVGNGPGIIY